MADNTETPELSPEAAELAAIGRANREGVELPADTPKDDAAGEAVETVPGDEAESQSEGDERPDWLPEKFKSAEDLAKAYAELEKSQSRPKDDEPSDDEKSDDEKSDDEGDPREAFTAEVKTSVDDAAAEYAENGELSEETYGKLTDLLGQATVDTYLSGIAALEADLTAKVYETAGGEDAYKSAVEWAQENWSESKIEKFDNSLNDPDLRDVLIRSLMDDYSAANPSEGKFTRKGPGVAAGDVYNDKSEFLKDLAAADEAGDTLARRKATEKLQRSKKAGTLTEITPRTGLGRYNR